MDRLTRKFDSARTHMPKPIIKTVPGAEIGILAFGSSDPAVEEARALLAEEHKVRTDYLRLRALPIHTETREFIEQHRVVYVVEQNRDAQCLSILRLEMPERATMLKSVLHYSGLPIDAQSIVDEILAQEAKRS
jgi:2-oxoglutarate ferredoxin oxidoreductase subunit alpha